MVLTTSLLAYCINHVFFSPLNSDVLTFGVLLRLERLPVAQLANS